MKFKSMQENKQKLHIAPLCGNTISYTEIKFEIWRVNLNDFTTEKLWDGFPVL